MSAKPQFEGEHVDGAFERQEDAFRRWITAFFSLFFEIQRREACLRAALRSSMVLCIL